MGVSQQFIYAGLAVQWNMRTTEPVGIVGYGGYVPMYRIHDEEIARAWGADERILPVARFRERLIGSKCSKCGLVRYPPRIVCPKCHGKEHQEVQLPRVGKLLTYTLTRKGPVEFKGQEPYAVGLVDLGGGVRVLSQLTDVVLNDIKPGMELEATLRRYREDSDEGIILYGIKFRPMLARKAS